MRPELVGTSRARLLQVLRANQEPMSSHELADACGLHVTTVRFHLEILSDSGLIDARLQRHGRGRPRLLYSLNASASTPDLDEPPSDDPKAPPATDPPAQATSKYGGETDTDHEPSTSGQESDYQGLAMLLAAHWNDASGTPAARATQAGRQAAEPPYAATPPSRAHAGRTSTASVDREMTMARAAQLISSEFAERGFSPELAHDGPATVIRLRACPFQAVARVHPEVVCAVHLGLLQGSWEKLGAPPIHASLHPFSESGVCLARLTPSASAAGSSSELLRPGVAPAD